jgi:hypothetical protein
MKHLDPSRTIVALKVFRGALMLSSYMRALAVLAVLAVGCGQRPVQAFPSELRAHAAELAADGRAEIDSVDDGRFTVSATTRVKVARLDNGARLVREVSIAELVDGCAAPGTPTRACLADQVEDREMVVGVRRTRNVGAGLTSALSAVAGLALVGGCLAECENKDIALGAGLIVAGAGLFVLMLATMK